MFEKIILNLRHPKGFLGSLILSMMNMGHSPLIKSVLKQESFSNSDIVLDIGCGGGMAVDYMSDFVNKVYGVDYSKAAVEKAAKKNFTKIKNGKVRIIQANVDELPFEPESFNYITAFETIYFWENLPKNLADIYKLLKPEGKLIIALEAYKENGAIKNYSSVLDCLNLKLYEAEELVGLLKKAGFESTFITRGKKMASWLCVSGVKT